MPEMGQRTGKLVLAGARPTVQAEIVVLLAFALLLPLLLVHGHMLLFSLAPLLPYVLPQAS